MTSSGRAPVTFPITMQDITPYGNGVDHLNSILQPATATTAPVVGVAIGAESAVPGCATGASHEVDIAEAVRFAIEVAKEMGSGTCRFHDEAEFAPAGLAVRRHAPPAGGGGTADAPDLGTVTIGQAPRADVTPTLDAHVPAGVERVHVGVLDRLSDADIAVRYAPRPASTGSSRAC